MSVECLTLTQKEMTFFHPSKVKKHHGRGVKELCELKIGEGMGGGLLFSQYGLPFAVTHTGYDGLYEA